MIVFVVTPSPVSPSPWGLGKGKGKGMNRKRGCAPLKHPAKGWEKGRGDYKLNQRKRGGDLPHQWGWGEY